MAERLNHYHPARSGETALSGQVVYTMEATSEDVAQSRAELMGDRVEELSELFASDPDKQKFLMKMVMFGSLVGGPAIYFLMQPSTYEFISKVTDALSGQ